MCVAILKYKDPYEVVMHPGEIWNDMIPWLNITYYGELWNCIVRIGLFIDVITYHFKWLYGGKYVCNIQLTLVSC